MRCVCVFAGSGYLAKLIHLLAAYDAIIDPLLEKTPSQDVARFAMQRDSSKRDHIPIVNKTCVFGSTSEITLSEVYIPIVCLTLSTAPPLGGGAGAAPRRGAQRARARAAAARRRGHAPQGSGAARRAAHVARASTVVGGRIFGWARGG